MVGQQQFSIEVRCCCYNAVNNSDGKSAAYWLVQGNGSVKHNTFPKTGWAPEAWAHLPFYLGLPPTGKD